MEIYIVKNINNGKSYIGKTKQGVSKRWSQHVYEAIFPRKIDPRNSYFYNAIRKYGKEAFSIETICRCPDNETANICEKFFIWILGTTKRSLGYNGTIGGEGGDFTEDVRLRMSISHTGKKIGPASEERKIKIGNAHRGRKYPERQGKPLHPNTVKAMIKANSLPKSEEHKKKISETLKRKHEEKKCHSQQM
jgi:group I intron endonuclease